MKKIFLYAYDRQNLGDDLFVRTIVNRYPHVKFYMLSVRENQRTFSTLSNLKVIDKDSYWMNILEKIRPSFVARYRNSFENRCDAVVYIGGSIFIEYEPWQNYVAWWKYHAEKKPMYAIGANWGPYQTAAYLQEMDSAFGAMRDVCFRDRYSYQRFRLNPNVRLAPDILFSYPMPKRTVKARQIFVSLIDCFSPEHTALAPYGKAYLENMKELLKFHISNGYHIVLTSFCKHEGDEDAVNSLYDRLRRENCGDNVRMLFYDGTNTAAIVEAIAASEGVISTRFHGVVLALAAGKPVLPIIYSDKTAHMLEDIGFSGMVQELRTPLPWNIAVLEKHWMENPCSLPMKIMDEASKHFQELDKLLL